MRSDGSSGFEAELRIAPQPILVLQTVLVIATILVQIGLPEPRPLLDPALALLVLTGITWLVIAQYPAALRWLLVVTSIATVYGLDALLRLPGLSGLYAVPVMLGAALAGRRWAPVIAIVETLLVLAERAVVAPAGSGALIAALVVIWATLGVTLNLYRPMIQLAGWAWAHAVHKTDEIATAIIGFNAFTSTHCLLN